MDVLALPLELELATILIVQAVFANNEQWKIENKSDCYYTINISFKLNNTHNSSNKEFDITLLFAGHDTRLMLSIERDDFFSSFYYKLDSKHWVDGLGEVVDGPAQNKAEFETIAERLYPVFQRCFPLI